MNNEYFYKQGYENAEKTMDTLVENKIKFTKSILEKDLELVTKGILLKVGTSDDSFANDITGWVKEGYYTCIKENYKLDEVNNT